MTPQNIAQILSVLHSKKEVIIFRTSKEHMLMGGKVIINFTCCSAVSDVLMFCISSFFLLSCSSSCSKNFIFSSWSFSWSSATKVDSADDSLGGLKRKCLDFKFMSYTESQNIWKKQTYRNHVSFETVFSEIFNEYCIPIKSLLIFNSLFNYVYLSTQALFSSTLQWLYFWNFLERGTFVFTFWTQGMESGETRKKDRSIPLRFLVCQNAMPTVPL